MATGFTLTFTGDQEVPPNGSAASGAGTVAWDSAARTATYEYTVTGVDFGPVLGLTPQTATTADDVTIMHVHNQPAAQRPGGLRTNRPRAGRRRPPHRAERRRLLDGQRRLGGDRSGQRLDHRIRPALDLAFAGLEVPLYANIHTTTFPGGEIRAQWTAEPGPVDWDAVAAVVLANFEATGPWFLI